MVETDQSVRTKGGSETAGWMPPAGAWARLLESTIQAEILPVLLAAGPPRPNAAQVAQREIEHFVALVLADDQAAVNATVQRILAGPGGRKALLVQLLTPAARHIGVLWERDLCNFMDVTLGVHRLDMLMRETEFADGQKPVLPSHQHNALLLPAPGEQHRFGIAMVADVFRAGGWRVSSGAALPRARLLRRVRGECFDVLGLSISAERQLGSIATSLRAIRLASRNPALLIMLGGHAIIGHEERSRFLGADMVAENAYQALDDANMMMTAAASRQSPQHARQFNLT